MKIRNTLFVLLFLIASLSSGQAYSGFRLTRFLKNTGKVVVRVGKELERGGRNIGKKVKVLDFVGRTVIDIGKSGVKFFEVVLLQEHAVNVLIIKDEVIEIKNKAKESLVNMNDLRGKIRQAQSSDELDSILVGISRVLARTINTSSNYGSLEYFYNDMERVHLNVSDLILQLNLQEAQLSNGLVNNCIQKLNTDEWEISISKAEALDSVENCLFDNVDDVPLWTTEKLNQEYSAISSDNENGELYKVYQLEIQKVKGLKQKIVRGIDGVIIGLENLIGAAGDLENDATEIYQKISAQL